MIPACRLWEEWVVDRFSDEALMERLATGDLDALAPLYDRYGRMVASLALRTESSLTPEQADDVCQEVFLTLSSTAPRYKEEGRLRSWICGITVRKVKAWRRKSWVRRALHRQHGDVSAGVSLYRGPSPVAQAEAREQVRIALDALPAGQREVVVLHLVEGLSGAEVASALGMSENAVWIRLHRARKTLASQVGGR